MAYDPFCPLRARRTALMSASSVLLEEMKSEEFSGERYASISAAFDTLHKLEVELRERQEAQDAQQRERVVW